MSAVADTVRPGPPKSGARLRQALSIPRAPRLPSSIPSLLEPNRPCEEVHCDGRDADVYAHLQNGSGTFLTFACSSCAEKHFPAGTRVTPIRKKAAAG